MLRLKAKTKVRYAGLLCLLVVIVTYVGLKNSRSTRKKTVDITIKNHRRNGDFTRRSFTAKWHDGRGLLNEVSETKKNENIRAKFVKHLSENQLPDREISHRIDLVGRNQGISDALASVRERQINENEAEIQEHDQMDEADEIVTTAAMSQESFLRNLVKTKSEGNKMKPTEERVRVTSEIYRQMHITKAMQKGRNRDNAGRLDKGKLVLHEKDVADEKTNVNQNQARKKHQAANDVVEVVNKSNRTIFDPSDHEITYQILHDDKDFSRSLLDDTRRYDSSWRPDFPITPQEAIARYGDKIPVWEKFEIMHYPKIYFMGLGANKTRLTTNATENFGYDYFHDDEEEGHYKVVPGDHIGYRYEIIKFLGSGTFGAVVLARDWSQPMTRNVALKIMHYDENDKYIIREMNMMKVIEKNATNRAYFSRLLATFNFRNHKCLVLELLGQSLHRHRFGPVSDMAVFRRYAHDILMGLHYLKELNLVHADMKPGNIMFLNGKNNESEGQLLKIADFGIGCIPGNKDLFKCPAYYVQTRYYRAPEVILGVGINPAVDMFSLGVIFSEFFLGSPPFFGETETDHLAAMMETLGLPPTYMIAKSPRKKVYQRAICYETENGFKRRPYRKPLTKVLHGMDPELFDLIARCLEYDPKLRITPEEALKHPFVTGRKPKEKLKTPISMQRFQGKI